MTRNFCSNPVDRHNTSNDERNQSDSEDNMDDEVQSPQNINAQPAEVHNIEMINFSFLKSREKIDQIAKQHLQIEIHQYLELKIMTEK